MKLSELFNYTFPKEYHFVAMDWSGYWYLYKNQPVKGDDGFWHGINGDEKYFLYPYDGFRPVYIGPDVCWRESLIDLDQFER